MPDQPIRGRTEKREKWLRCMSVVSEVRAMSVVCVMSVMR